MAAASKPRPATCASAARSSPGGPFIHGAAKAITSSTSGTRPASAAPAGEVSSVMRQPGSESRSARMAGVVISTSPMLSRRTQRTLRACCQPLMPFQDQCGRLAQVGRDKVGKARFGEPPFGLIAVVQQHGAAARAPARLYIVEDVADHPRTLEAYAMLARGAQQHALR